MTGPVETTSARPARRSRGVLLARVRGVDELLSAVVPELQVGLQVSARRDGDLQGVGGLSCGHPCRAPFVAVHQQPGVVGPHRAGGDQAGVRLGTHVVHPVEVLAVARQEAFGVGVVDVDVHGCGHVQQDVRAGH